MKIWPTSKLLWSIIVPPRTKKKFAPIARLIQVWQLFGLRERFEIRWARYSTPGLCSNAEAGLMCCNMFRMTRSYSQVEHLGQASDKDVLLSFPDNACFRWDHPYPGLSVAGFWCLPLLLATVPRKQEDKKLWNQKDLGPLLHDNTH